MPIRGEGSLRGPPWPILILRPLSAITPSSQLSQNVHLEMLFFRVILIVNPDKLDALHATEKIREFLACWIAMSFVVFFI